MIIYILSRLMAESKFIARSNQDKKIIAISIYSSGDQPANLPYCQRVLALNFDDVSVSDIPGTIPFGIKHAAKIKEFMEKNLDADVLVVHCDAGVSRSPAVAIAIAEHYFDDKKLYKLHPLYNRMVYFTLMGKLKYGLGFVDNYSVD